MIFNFVLKQNLNIGKITIQLRDEQEKVHYLDTSLTITPGMWDEIKQRPKNIYLKQFKKLNIRLDRIKIMIASYLKNITLKKVKLSLSALSRKIKKIISVQEIHYIDGSLLGYMDKYIHSREHLISKTTYKRYMVFFRLLERFDGDQMKHLMIENVNGKFVKNFLIFGKKEEYSPSTIYRTIHFVRTILNFLEKRGIRTFVYELELPKVKKHKENFVTLTEDELITINKIEVPTYLKPARDWLIISCYSGQRVSDFMNFNMDMMEIIHDKQCLSFIQQKTQKSILLPLHPAALFIMSKNRGFPIKLSPQKYNEQIKEVVKLAGITKLVKVRKRSGFRSNIVMVPKWEAVTSHIGRRSFASNFYGKIPTPLLMEATGHCSEQMFQRYISSADTERTICLSRYFEETYKNKFLVA